MIHSSSEVSIICIMMHNTITSNVYDIMRKYIIYAKNIKNENDPIVIDGNYTESLLTKDWTGWTGITGMEIDTNYESDWYKIEMLGSDNRSIIITGDQLIPLYHDSQSNEGEELQTKSFHGEVKFKFKLFRASDIYQMALNDVNELKDYKMRIRDIKEDGVVNTQFGKIGISLLRRKVDRPNFAYKIFTKSDFINVNGFHIYSKDNISENSKDFK